MLSYRAGSWIVLSAATAALARCGGCDRDHSPGTSSGSAGVDDGSTLDGAVAVAARAQPPGRPACRAIAIDGEVWVEGISDAGKTPLLLQGLVPERTFIDLSNGARFVAKDPRTTRETTFHGPARVKACVGGAEESWVASGTFESAVGAGEAPGNEEWVVTPLGVVRYGAAKVAVDVHRRGSKSEVSVTVASGSVELWLAGGAKATGADGGGAPQADEGWIRVNAGTIRLSTSIADMSLEGARDAIDECTSLGQDAHDLSAVLLAGGADASTVTAQVSTRRRARAACAIGGLRVMAQPPSDQLGPLLWNLASGNTSWSTLASTPPPSSAK